MPKGRSLHIGLNKVSPEHYDGWDGQLRACVNDANDMQNLAESCGFHTLLLVDADATREAVYQEISKASDVSESGDYYFITYSGHGGQLPDRNGDEPDNEDETWCLYNGQLLDDEIYELLCQFREGVRILVFSDSCHSGTVLRNVERSIRGEGVQEISKEILYSDMSHIIFDSQEVSYRNMPSEYVSRTYAANKQFYDRIISKLPKNMYHKQIQALAILISGCQDNQLSLDGNFNGAFTAAVLKTWSQGNFRGSIKEFHTSVLGQMPPTQSPNMFFLSPNLDAFANSRILFI